MTRAPSFTAKPAILGKAYGWCPTHAVSWRVDGEQPGCWRCATFVKGAVPPRVGPPESRVRLPRAGSDTEALLAAQLSAAGYIDTTEREKPYQCVPTPDTICFRRQHPWGLALSPERGFTADVAFLGASLLCEVKGLAHAAGRAKVKSDVEREGLAVSLGWRVLPLTPESVRDGTAVALIAAALSAKEV